jgi:hypothetical protein
MNKIIEFIDFLIISTQEGLKWNWDGYNQIFILYDDTTPVVKISRVEKVLLFIGAYTINQRDWPSIGNKLDILYDEIRYNNLWNKERRDKLESEMERLIIKL